MTPAEIISNVVATIALILSVYGFRRDKKTEKRNHEFDLFRDIYQEFLVIRLPTARAKVKISRAGLVSGVDELIHELNEIRKQSIYFSYAEPQFFEELKMTLWELEDYLTLIEEPFVGEARVDFDHEVTAKLKKIYKCILRKF